LRRRFLAIAPLLIGRKTDTISGVKNTAANCLGVALSGPFRPSSASALRRLPNLLKCLPGAFAPAPLIGKD
jgi:hypothetical protein